MNVLEGFAAKSPLDGKAHPDTQRRSQAGERALISIGMPVYNCATTVAQSIKSIINQTYDHWELIIIDDGSSDNTLEIVKTFSDPRIRLIEGGENQGLPARLNEAVSVSRGRFFARMDGDDVSYPERFELQLEYLKRHPDVDVLGGTILVFNNDGTAIGIRKAVLSHEEIRGAFWETFRLAHVTWLGKIEWFRRNSYRVSALNSQDRELLLRTHRFSRFAAIPEVLVAVREPNLSWKKLLPARTQHFSNLLRESVVQKDPKLLFLSAPAEIVKTAFDFIATHTGLGYRLLRHRLPPVDQELVARWQKLWAEVWNATTQPITNESVSPTKTLA